MSKETLIIEGKIITSIDKIDTDKELIFTDSDGIKYRMYHPRDCCEDVYLDDINGDLDDIINSNIRENSSNISMDNNESIDKKCSVKDHVSDIKDDDIVNDDTLSNRKKYNSETIALVRSLYEKHKKVKKVKQVLETEYNFKPISQQTINKMWNNKY